MMHWKNVLNYSWRKANARPPRLLSQDLTRPSNLIESISKLVISKFIRVYTDEWYCNLHYFLYIYKWRKVKQLIKQSEALLKEITNYCLMEQ